MGAVNPSLITTLIFKKRPVQNVLQQLAFAINARASVNQVMTRRVALAGGTGIASAASPGKPPYYTTTNAPGGTSDYAEFVQPLLAPNTAEVRVYASGATRLPSNLTGTTVVLDLAWAPVGAFAGNIYRKVNVARWRANSTGVANVGFIGPGTLALAANESPVAESLSINIGSGATEVLPDDYLFVTAWREASDASDTFASSVFLIALDLTYQESVTFAS